MRTDIRFRMAARFIYWAIVLACSAWYLFAVLSRVVINEQ